MQLEHVIEFVEVLGLKHVDVADPWVRSTCPFPWLHPAGRDRHPSFGIFASDDGPSYFHCFAHGGGDLPRIVHTLTWKYPKRDYAEAHEFIFQHELAEDKAKVEYRDPYAKGRVQPWKLVKVNPISLEVLDQFPRVIEFKNPMRWLKKQRKLSEFVIRVHDIRYNPQQEAIIIPICGKGGLYHVLVRHVTEKKFYFLTPEMANTDIEFPKMKETGVFFGEDLVRYDRPVLIVEAALEAMTIKSFGIQNVIATCMPINNAQLKRLSFPTIFSGFDSDASGKRSRDKVIGKCRDKSKVYVIDWKKSVGCKDPGELESKEQLIAAVKARRLISSSEKRWEGGDGASIEDVL